MKEEDMSKYFTFVKLVPVVEKQLEAVWVFTAGNINSLLMGKLNRVGALIHTKLFKVMCLFLIRVSFRICTCEKL